MLRLAILSDLLGGDARSAPFLEPLRRVAGELAGHGVALVRSDPDLVLADTARVETAAVACPLVLFDVGDGGMLWWYGAPHGDRARTWLRSGRVLGMIKVTRYRSAALYNAAVAEGAYHLHRVYAVAGADLAPRLVTPACPLTDEDLGRIELGFGFWAFDWCDLLAGAPPVPDAGRDIDVFCAATAAYASPGVAYHRERAFAALERLRGCRTVLRRGRVLSRAEYAALMRRARVCVSPWGWGETAFRDYETMYAGCVLVKPLTDFIDAYPPIDTRHYIPCAVDFSDLQEKVDHVLARWDDYEEMRRQNRERLLAVRRPDAVAGRFAAILHRFVAGIA
jgi:hypothetical protein